MDEQEARHRAAGLPFLLLSAVMFISFFDTGIFTVGTTSIGLAALFGILGVTGLIEPRFGQILFQFLDQDDREGSDSRSQNQQVINVEGDNNTIESDNASK